ncbi:Beta-glucuronidase, partial [Temnothorax longispinosus]
SDFFTDGDADGESENRRARGSEERSARFSGRLPAGRRAAPLDAERSGVVTLGEPEAQARMLHIGAAVPSLRTEMTGTTSLFGNFSSDAVTRLAIERGDRCKTIVAIRGIRDTSAVVYLCIRATRGNDLMLWEGKSALVGGHRARKPILLRTRPRGLKNSFFRESASKDSFHFKQES